MVLYPMIRSLKNWKALLSKDFVKQSAIISSVGQYSTIISPFSILSFVKKYLTAICLEFPVC